MYGLVDCNNFYCSCERVFDPSIRERPVIVLSNNDGCAVARSEEAKALGIEMGTPLYQIQDLVKKHDVAVFSSNYTLYGDTSARVMRTLSGFVEKMEVYSIDEAFLDMHNMRYTDLEKLGIEIKKTVRQNTGIPTCVGIAPTKTLAKMANRYAKKKVREKGVYAAVDQQSIDQMLHFTEVGNIWGIGRQYAHLLEKNGFKTAYDLRSAPLDWIRKEMSVVGLRLVKELNGIPAIGWEFVPPEKKVIGTAKSFGKLLNDKRELRAAVAHYATNIALKLRTQKSTTGTIQVFLNTNPHRKNEGQYNPGLTVKMETASNLTPDLVKSALKGFEIIYRPGYNYLRFGLMAMDLQPENVVQTNLFASKDKEREKKVAQAMDKINRAFGKDFLRVATVGFSNKHGLKTAMISQKFTTDINQLLTINI